MRSEGTFRCKMIVKFIFVAKFLLNKAANGGGVLVIGIAAGHRRKVNLKNDCLYILLDDCDLDKTISNVYLLFALRFLVEHEVQVHLTGCAEEE